MAVGQRGKKKWCDDAVQQLRKELMAFLLMAVEEVGCIDMKEEGRASSEYTPLIFVTSHYNRAELHAFHTIKRLANMNYPVLTRLLRPPRRSRMVS
jgi:hypothetical protein